MPDTIDVRMSHPWQDHEIGDVISVDAAQARQLITAGVAVAADDTIDAETPEPEAEADQPAPRRRR